MTSSRSEAVCHITPGTITTACGRRRPSHVTLTREKVTCGDCQAALNADLASQS